MCERLEMGIGEVGEGRFFFFGGWVMIEEEIERRGTCGNRN